MVKPTSFEALVKMVEDEEVEEKEDRQDKVRASDLPLASPKEGVAKGRVIPFRERRTECWKRREEGAKQGTLPAARSEETRLLGVRHRGSFRPGISLHIPAGD